MGSEVFSAERFGRLHDVMANHVERGELPGLVTLVCRHGEVQIDSIGKRALGDGASMSADTLFRITSMTKPILGAATMILLEEGRLKLDEAVDRLLPELANRQVLRRIEAEVDDTVPASRPISVRDLLTFRMGFGLILDPWDRLPIQKAAAELDLSLGAPLPRTPHSPDEWIHRLGTLPLMAQPGERWLYNTSADVLGVLLSRAANQPLDDLLRERLFEPLGMKDTGFRVPPGKLKRLAGCYELDSSTSSLTAHDGIEDSAWSQSPAFPSGADGLVSTIEDYLSFGRMLLNEGVHDGKRLLSRLSVEAMITDQLTAEQKARSPFFPGFWENRGWGFGLSVITGPDGVTAAPGRFGWDGGYGTSWASDPNEGIVAILMSQRLGADELFSDFWTGVYAAMDSE